MNKVERQTHPLYDLRRASDSNICKNKDKYSLHRIFMRIKWGNTDNYLACYLWDNTESYISLYPWFPKQDSRKPPKFPTDKRSTSKHFCSTEVTWKGSSMEARVRKRSSHDCKPGVFRTPSALQRRRERLEMELIIDYFHENKFHKSQ